jgi:hypothetical protein
MIALALCLSLVWSGGQTAPSAATPQEAPSDDSLRVYDLSGIQLRFDHEQNQLDSRMLPFLIFDSSFRSKESFDEMEERQGADSLADMITDLYGDEFEYEGRELRVGRPNQLIVRGPAALHERIERLIQFFDGMLNSYVDLRIDVLGMPQRGQQVSAVLDEAQVDELISAVLSQGGTHEFYMLQARADRPAVVDLVRNVPAVVDADVEIAQAAAIFDPVSVTAAYGTRLGLKATPGKGGLHLAIGWRRGDEMEGAGSRPLRAKFLVTAAKEDVAFIEASAVLQNLQVLARGAGWTTFLPDGKAIVLQTVVRLKRGSLNEMVVIRHVGGDLPLQSTLPLDSNGLAMTIFNGDALSPPALAGVGSLLWPGRIPTSLRNYFSAKAPFLAVELRNGHKDPFIDTVSEGMDATAVESKGPWLIVRPYRVGDDVPKALEEHKRAQETLAALVPDPSLIDLTIRLTRPGAPERAAARVRVPIASGRSCTVVLGIEDLEVPDYDVEVAQFCATPDPMVQAAFDGLALWIKPSVNAAGEVFLDIRGGAHLLEKRTSLAFDGNVIDSVDQSTYQRLLVNERVQLPYDADGRRRVAFGVQADAKSPNGLRLEIEAH